MTTFQAIDRRDGEVKLWRGPNFEAIGHADCQFLIENAGMHYLKIEGAILKDTDGNIIEGLKLFN